MAPDQAMQALRNSRNVPNAASAKKRQAPNLWEWKA